MRKAELTMTGKGQKKFDAHDVVILVVAFAVGLLIVIQVLTRRPESPGDQSRY
jgi:hypothetical protein